MKIRGYEFLIVENDRRRWVRLVTARNGLYGNETLAAVNGPTFNDLKMPSLCRKLLRRARIQLDIDGEVRVVKSWKLPPDERFETIRPDRIEDIRTIRA